MQRSAWRRVLPAALIVFSAVPSVRAEPQQVRPTGALILYEDAASMTALPRFMGAAEQMTCEINWQEAARAGSSCIRIAHHGVDRWGSVFWPARIVDARGRVNLAGASRIAFWARGETGDEHVDFKFSAVPESIAVSMTGPIRLRGVRLSREWQRYEIDLLNRNLGTVKLGVALSVVARDRPATVYIDDIVVE
jgi:hypothetical protein